MFRAPSPFRPIPKGFESIDAVRVYMLPRSTIYDLRNSGICNSEEFSNFAVKKPSIYPESDYFFNISLCEMRLFVPLAVAYAKLLRRVFDIITIGSKPKMCWIYTSWIVPAWAVVTHQHPFWNRTKVKHPACPVSPPNESAVPPTAYAAVAPTSYRCRPQPAGISDSDFGKKSLWETWSYALRFEIFCGNYVPFSIHRMLGRVSGCLYSAGTFLFSPHSYRIQGKS